MRSKSQNAIQFLKRGAMSVVGLERENNVMFWLFEVFLLNTNSSCVVPPFSRGVPEQPIMREGRCV